MLLKALYYGVPGSEKRVVQVTSTSDDVSFVPRRGTDGNMYFLFQADQTGTFGLEVQVEDDDTVYTCDATFSLPELGCYSSAERTEEGLYANGKIPYTEGEEKQFWILRPGGMSGSVSYSNYPGELTMEHVQTEDGLGLLVTIPATAVIQDGAYCAITEGEDTIYVYPHSDEPALYARNSVWFEGSYYESLSIPWRLDTLDLGQQSQWMHLYYGVWGSEELVTDVSSQDQAALTVYSREDAQGKTMFRFVSEQVGEVTMSAWVGDTEHVCRLESCLPSLGVYRTAERSEESICSENIIPYIPGTGGEVWVLFEDGFTGEEVVTLENAADGMTWAFRDVQEGKGLVVTYPDTMEGNINANLTILNIANWGGAGFTLRFRPTEAVLWGDMSSADPEAEFEGLIGIPHVWKLSYGTKYDRKTVTAIEPLCDAVELQSAWDDGSYQLYCEKEGVYPARIWVEGQENPIIVEMNYALPVYGFYRGPQIEANSLYTKNMIPYAGESISIWMIGRDGILPEDAEVSLWKWNEETGETSELSGFTWSVEPLYGDDGDVGLRIDIPAGLDVSSDRIMVQVENVTTQGFRLQESGARLLARDYPADAPVPFVDERFPLREIGGLTPGTTWVGYLYYGVPGGEKQVVDARLVGPCDVSIHHGQDSDGNIVFSIVTSTSKTDTVCVEVQVEGDDTWYDWELDLELPGISTYNENTRTNETLLIGNGLYIPGEGGQFYVLRENGFFGDEEITYTRDLGLTAEFVDGGWLFTIPDTVTEDCDTIIEFRGAASARCM